MLLVSNGGRPGCCHTSCYTGQPPNPALSSPQCQQRQSWKRSPVVFILLLVGFIRLLATVLPMGRSDSHCSVVTAFSHMAYSLLSVCRHTSIVVHKDEFFFGSGGISSCPPVSVPPQRCPASRVPGIPRDQELSCHSAFSSRPRVCRPAA